MTAVAMIGTGRMGAAMVGRLRLAGHDVTVFNRTRARASEVASRTVASVADSPREAVAGAEFVLVSLADDAAVQDAYHGPSGLVAGLPSGAVVLELSTVHPDTIRALASPVESRGAVLLDAPVSGSVSLVERGELTVLAGGPSAALDLARPVLGAFASRILHVGPLGSGATMKLAVNSILYGLNQAVAEALVLAEKAGVDRAMAYDAFEASAIAAPFVHYKRASFLEPSQTPVAFALDLVAKDLDLIESLAADAGARVDQVAANRRIVEEAVAAGIGTRDLSAIAELLRD